MKNKKKSMIIITIISIIVLVIAAIISAIVIYNAGSDARRLKSSLELARKYLNDEEYEESIVEYLAVIEIDNTNVEAYLNASTAYEALNRLEEAVELLQKGYEITEDEKIKERIDELLEIINATADLQSLKTRFVLGDLFLEEYDYIGYENEKIDYSFMYRDTYATNVIDGASAPIVVVYPAGIIDTVPCYDLYYLTDEEYEALDLLENLNKNIHEAYGKRLLKEANLDYVISIDNLEFVTIFYSYRNTDFNENVTVVTLIEKVDDGYLISEGQFVTENDYEIIIREMITALYTYNPKRTIEDLSEYVWFAPADNSYKVLVDPKYDYYPNEAGFISFLYDDTDDVWYMLARVLNENNKSLEEYLDYLTQNSLNQLMHYDGEISHSSYTKVPYGDRVLLQTEASYVRDDGLNQYLSIYVEMMDDGSIMVYGGMHTDDRGFKDMIDAIALAINSVTLE